MKGAVVCVSICIADGRINGLLGCAPHCDYTAGMRVAEFTAAGIGSSCSQVWTTKSQADRNVLMGSPGLLQQVLPWTKKPN